MTHLQSARKAILLSSILLAAATASVFVISFVSHPSDMRRIHETPSGKTEYWLFEGDVGWRRTVQVDRSAMHQEVSIVEAHIDGKVLPLYLPTTLSELRWQGFEMSRAEQWFPRKGVGHQWILIRIPLWMPLLVFSVYPGLLLMKRLLRWSKRLALRTGWLRVILGATASALLGVAAIFLSLALFVPEHLIVATVFFVPGGAMFSLLWLFRRTTDVTSAQTNASSNPFGHANVQSQIGGSQQ